MGVVVGIDVGGSTTKIVGFHQKEQDCCLIEPQCVHAADPVTSIYGAFGKFTAQNNLELSMIDRVMMTGVGSTYIANTIYNLPSTTVPEFRSIGRGGLYLSGLEEAIVVSMGTGTAIVCAKVGQEPVYLGGTGVGGGTLTGLSKKILGMEDMSHLDALAQNGDLSRVDLRVGDITKKDILPGMPDHLTAANFGKVSDIATNADIALGLMNMVFETVGMMAIFAARAQGMKDIVLTGNLTTLSYCQKVYEELSTMFGVHFIIPKLAQFGPVIGAALCGR